MPLKILTESAALAAGPVTYTCSPGSPEDPMLCTRLTKLVIPLLKPRWASMRTSAALWSRDGTGPMTFPASFSVANALRVRGDLGQVGGSQPGGPHVDHDRRVQVLRGEVVLQLERLRRTPRQRRQVRGGVVLLDAHQLPGQGPGQRDHDHPEDQHGPLGAPPAGQARDAMCPATPPACRPPDPLAREPRSAAAYAACRRPPAPSCRQVWQGAASRGKRGRSARPLSSWRVPRDPADRAC